NNTSTTGRFANTGINPRILTLTYPGCTNEVVSYIPDNLQNINGARVDFDFSGNPTYLLGGCTAPVSTFEIEAGSNPAPVCPGGTVSLSAQINGSASFQQWSGGTGSFTNPGNTTTN